MYKKYIFRNGKRFGPYYCESYRNKQGKVKTRFVSGPRKKDIFIKKTKEKFKEFNKPKRILLILGIIFSIFLLLFLGNLNYSYLTGKVVEQGEPRVISSADLGIAEQIANKELVSTTDVRKDVNLKVKRPFSGNKIMEFDVPEGKIILDFNLLNYSEFVEKERENQIKAENFDINVNKSAEKYKWGYDVRLRDLSFMAKIDVRTSGTITIIDNQTLKIGNNYISFSDLSNQGYVVRVENPAILEEINITKPNITAPGGSGNYIPGSSSKVNSQEPTSPTPQPTPPAPQPTPPTPQPTPPAPQPPVTGSNSYVTGNLVGPRINFLTLVFVKMNAFVKDGLMGVKGFIVQGFRGITGLVINEENVVSVYVQRDFGKQGLLSEDNKTYKIGDLINLDPELIRIMADTTAPSIEFGSNTPAEGSIQQSTSIFVNVSASDSESNVSTFIDFDNSLVSWWRMDDVNGSGDPTDYMGRNNGTKLGGAAQTDSGYFGKGLELNNTGNVGFYSPVLPVGSNNVSFGGWIKWNNFYESDTFVISQAPVGEYGYSIANSGNLLYCFDGYTTSDPAYTLEAGEWYQVMCVYNSAQIISYVNGAEWDIEETGIRSVDNADFYFGSPLFNGTLDDIMVFNRSLSASEISALYANQSSRYLTKNFTNLADGNHTFKAYVQDILGNVNLTETRTVNLLAPFQVTILSPITTQTTSTTSFNISLNKNASWCGLSLDGSANITITLNSSLTGANYINSTMSDGSHTAVFTCNNTDGNFSSASVSFSTDLWLITTCGTLSKANTVYTLQNSITATTTCFNILADNITLDGNGYTITGDGVGTDYGVSASGRNNITIKNFAGISKFYNGIYFNSTANSLITNVTLYSNLGAGIKLFWSSNNQLSNITANNNNNGIVLSESSNNQLSNITANNNNNNGIYLSSSSNNQLNNITVNNNNNGIYLSSSSNDQLSNITANKNYKGIYFSVSSNNNLNGITANSNKWEGIYLDTNSNNNQLNNITVNSNVYEGIVLVTNSNNNLNGLTANSNSWGIYLASSSNNNITNGNFSDNTEYDVYLFLGSTNNIFLNASYTLSKESVNTGGSLTRKWYYSAYVNDTLGNNVANANVFAYNVSGDYQFNLTTGSDGKTGQAGIIEYVNTGGTKTYCSNYTIYALNLSHKGDISFNVTLETNKLNSVITISQDTNPPVISNVNALIILKGANINWLTDEPANSSVDYGTTVSLGNVSSFSDSLLKHSVNLDFLEGEVLYYYNVTSCDFAGNCVTNGTYNFTTNPIKNATSCGTLSDANTIYTLQNSITATTTCFNILADNITLDGNGYTITGSNSGVGISAKGRNNIIIKNFYNITDFDSGIVLSGGSNNQLSNITANNNNHGIELYSSSNNQLNNITVNNNNRGIYFFVSSNNNLNGITANLNKWNGIFLDINSNNNQLNNITVNSNVYEGIVLNSNSNNNLNGLTANSNSWGIHLASSSNNNITNGNFSDNTEYDVHLFLGSTNNIFLNASYTLSKESVNTGGSLTRKWYYRAHTSDISGTNVNNASVDIYNGLSSTPYIQLTTNATGWTNTTSIIEYVNTGGTKTYYQHSVIAANYNLTLNLTLWASHSYINVTQEQNNLNDSFVLDIDKTSPTLSGTSISMTSSSSVNSVVAIISWNTNANDPAASSSIIYGLTTSLDSGSISSQVKTAAPSVTISSLMNNTLYYFNYTSCDFAGNCNTSSGSFTTISPASVGTASSGGGISCVPSWECEVCSGAPVGKTGTQTCNDLRKCSSIITKTQDCTVQESYFKTKESSEEKPEDKSMQTELSQPTGSGGRGAGCTSNWQCSNWSECKAVYDLEDIVKGRTLLKGEQSRTCKDLKCDNYEKTERQECSTKEKIYAEKTTKCYRDYLEVFNEKNILISRLELINQTYKQLNIQMLFDESGYCPYCFDGQKNYDEDEVDCNYNGKNCPKCSSELPLIRGNYVVFAIILMLVLLCSLFVIWYFVLWKKTKKRTKKILAMSRLSFEKETKKLRKFKLVPVLLIFIGFLIIIFGVIFSIKTKFFNNTTINIPGSLASLSNGIYSFFIPILIVLILVAFILIVRKIKDLRNVGIGIKEIGFESMNEFVGFYKYLLKEYKKTYKKLIKLRKKILRKKRKIIKKEKRIGSPLKHKREKIKRDIEKYKRGIERLESLKERINKLESLGYSNRETEKLKYELNKDIMNLRKRSK